jgi:predicted ATPase
MGRVRRGANGWTWLGRLITQRSEVQILPPLRRIALWHRPFLVEEARYTMLETIRDYAAGALSATGESDVFHQRHAEAFLEIAERAAPGLSGHDGRVLLDRHELEQHNQRAALSWFVTRGQPAPAMRMASAL